ncbi:MAG: hypothetical protein ACUVXI_01020 [bacterium]
MAKITIDEEKLGEIVEAAIDKRLQEGRFVSLDDVEAVRKSPAGAMLIIENDVRWLKANSATKEDIERLDGKIDRVAQELDGKIDRVAQELDGKIDRVAQELIGRIDGVFKELSGRIDGVSKGLGGKIDSIEGRLGLLIGLYFALLALFGSVAVKVFFFMP